jgi:hypothetical protein
MLVAPSAAGDTSNRVSPVALEALVALARASPVVDSIEVVAR